MISGFMNAFLYNMGGDLIADIKIDHVIIVVSWNSGHGYRNMKGHVEEQDR
ncbi:hypothetical protein D3C85_1779580 [compost metagenome]